MSHSLLFGLVLLNSASFILAIYSAHAATRGMAQGTFFIEQKAMILGFVGLILAAVISLYRANFSDFVVVELLSFFASSFLLAALGSMSQIYGILGFLIGLLIALFV